MSETRESESGRRLAQAEESNPESAVGTRVGRFSILSKIGQGGMGQIYEAYDPNLDRRIALKLLRVGDAESRARLAQEARALARLEHPNVVKVHDVGLDDETLFVAMEFLRGGSLEEWLANNPPGGRERHQVALGLLRDAAEGLVAAHRAGLVHRDVKPSNILIGSDYRARVADFGIARTGDERGVSGPAEPEVRETVLLSTDDGGTGNTGTDAWIGTPAYMAPEQLRKGSVGPAADQFSFCLTAWEAVFGVRPFPDIEPGARLVAIRNADPVRPEGAHVDPALEALLRVGLRFEPSQRHPRLEDLANGLTAHARKSAHSSKAWRRGLALAAIAGVSVSAAYRLGTEDDTCSSAARVAFERVWNDERRQRTRDAVLDLTFGPGALKRLEAGLDAYGESWTRAHTAACEATHVRAEQSSGQMVARTACLEQGTRSVTALLDLVSSGEASVLASEQRLLDALPSVEACAHERLAPLPTEDEWLARIAESRMLRSSGRGSSALEVLQPVMQELNEESSRFTRVRALFEYGLALIVASNPRLALEPLREAYALANGEAWTPMQSALARVLARVHSLLRSDPNIVRQWLLRAEEQGSITAVHDQLELLSLEGELRRRTGHPGDAIELFERRVSIAESDPARLPYARLRLAVELRSANQVERSVEIARRSLDEFRTEFGAEHPEVGGFERALATSLEALAHSAEDQAADEAEALAKSALRRSELTWGRGNLATNDALVRLSSVQCNVKKDVDAGLKSATAALNLHRQDELTSARRAALRAFVRCALRRNEQFAKEAWDLVFLTKAIFGEKHQETVLAQARYAQALARAPHPAVDGLWKQLLLASALAKEELPGWDRRTAIFVHGILGEIASNVAPGKMGLEHAEAALVLVLEDENVAELEVDVRRLLCHAKWEAGELQDALEECRIALEAAKDGQKPELTALVEFTLGRTLVELERHAEAVPHLEAAVRLVDQARIPRLLLSSELLLGQALEAAGRCSDAESHFLEAVALGDFSYGIVRFSAGAGSARMAACLGRFEDASARLRVLEDHARENDPAQRAIIAEATGFVRHAEHPGHGARHYEAALDALISTGRSKSVKRLCRDSPFALKECQRLGNPSGSK